MKYLKTYENTIKHTDYSAINHPLRNFSERLVNIMKEVSDNLIVRRYFNENGNISIWMMYKTHKLFNITLNYISDFDETLVSYKLNNIRWIKNDFSDLKSFIEAIEDILSKFDNNEQRVPVYLKRGDLHWFIGEIKSRLTAKKYNI